MPESHPNFLFAQHGCKARKLKKFVRVAKASRDAARVASKGAKVTNAVTAGAKIGAAAGPIGVVVGGLGGYGFYRMKKSLKRSL